MSAAPTTGEESSRSGTGLPLVEGRSLAIGYGLGRGRELRLLDHADFELDAGELVCLLGPNGSGKSTLLRTIAGMQRPLAGHVDLLGSDVRSRTPEWLARHVSVVLTEPIDVGVLTARELVGLGRYPYTDWLGRLEAADHDRVAAAIGAVHAEPLAEQPVRSLSDGERQRILIARALAQEPRLMILDEPTAYLDLPRRIETLGLLRRLVRSTGVAVLLSTHHLDLALDHADRVWLLPQGGPLTIGAPEDVALVGALERTFVSEGLDYDSAQGTFRLREDPASVVVVLEGEGLARRWAERALRREGFAAVEASRSGVKANGRAGAGTAAATTGAAAAPLARVRIAGVGRYLLDLDGERVECASLYELLERLKRSRRRQEESRGTREADRT